jgi:hypothetical protein
VRPDVAALVEKLVRALRAEDVARAGVRSAVAEQARLIGELRALGLPSTRIAHRVASANGTVLSVEARKRFAARLRQRLSRVTRGHGDLTAPHGQSPSADARSESRQEVIQMPKIVKRVTTIETYAEPDEPDESEDAESEDEADEQDETDDEEAPRRRQRR